MCCMVDWWRRVMRERLVVDGEMSGIQGMQQKKDCNERRIRPGLSAVRLHPFSLDSEGEQRAGLTQAVQTPLPEMPRTPGSVPPATPQPEIPATPDPEVPATPRGEIVLQSLPVTPVTNWWMHFFNVLQVIREPGAEFWQTTGNEEVRKQEIIQGSVSLDC